jgi:hypothetical protein
VSKEGVLFEEEGEKNKGNYDKTNMSCKRIPVKE